MRIASFEIKNFKGINEHGININFAPITMLFGPNNAGKSTVIQALHLAREIFCHNNLDPDKVEDGGDCVDLGYKL
jgi:AAA15 family ATPase/GTPase